MKVAHQRVVRKWHELSNDSRRKPRFQSKMLFIADTMLEVCIHLKEHQNVRFIAKPGMFSNHNEP